MRKAILTFVVVLAAAAAPAAFAQARIDKPVRIVVASPPNSTADLIARALGEHLGKPLGQPVTVEHRPGPGSATALDALLKSAADGSTLLLASDSQLIPHLRSGPAAASLEKAQAVAFLGATHFALAVDPSVSARTLKALFEMAKGKGLDIAATPDLQAAAIIQRLGSLSRTKLQRVPHKGPAAALGDVVSGKVQAAVVQAASLAPHVKSGKIRALAVFSGSRLSALPEVPTAMEQGVPVLVFNGFGILAPAGTSKQVVAALESTIASALERGEVREILGAVRVDPMFADGGAYSMYLKRLRPKAVAGMEEPAANPCDQCNSQICRKPGEDCRVCCTRG